MEDERIVEIARDFQKFSRNTRENFHEPDEQGIELKSVIGNRLDNAFGTHVLAHAIRGGFQEAIVFLARQGKDEVESYEFNLADVFALARRGAEAIVAESGRQESARHKTA